MDDDDDDYEYYYYYHHHNMATNLKVIMYFCSDTLPLVDMYNLNGLKEIIVCNLRIEKCHLFHKVRVSSTILSSVFSCSSTALIHNFLLNAFLTVCTVSYALVIFFFDLWPM